MYKLIITKDAQHELDEIDNYITLQLCNPEAALDFLQDLAECYQNLAEHPYMYQASNDAHLKAKGYRKAVIKNYILLYKVDDVAETVTIYGVFYGPSEYYNLL